MRPLQDFRADAISDFNGLQENSLRDETGNFLPEQGIFSRNRELQPLTPNPCDCLLGARFFVCASTAWFVAVSGEASLCG
jgi:hypothetical protein